MTGRLNGKMALVTAAARGMGHVAGTRVTFRLTPFTGYGATPDKARAVRDGDQ